MRLRFSHPSYSEAIKYILYENGTLTKSGKILSNVLRELSQDNFAAADVVKTIASNFDKLSEDSRNLLLEMAQNDHTAETVSEVIQNNLDKIPGNILYRLLIDLGKKDYKFWDTARVIADSIAFKSGKLPANLQPPLLRASAAFRLAEKDRAASDVASAITKNFDKLPPNVQQLLFKLSESDKTAGSVARAITDNFDKLPSKTREDLLLKLADNDEARFAVVRVAIAIVANFDKLPPNVQQLLLKLLFKLIEKAEYLHRVARAIAQNFDKLPSNIGEQLLLELAGKDSVAWEVSSVINDYSNNIPHDIRKELLAKLEEKRVP
jgi:hypothetical protein